MRHLLKNPLFRFAVTAGIVSILAACGQRAADTVAQTEWGHWRLGQKANLEFLRENHMTITFGSGAPNFEDVTREEFDGAMEKAKAFNRKYHDEGYLVLRYLSTSLSGESPSNKDTPQEDQIDLLKFWEERWEDFEDYIGPKPPEDPTTWMMVRSDGSFPYYRYAPYGRETTGGFEAWGCPHNPYYVRMMEGKIRAQAETGIDGSYIDWTHMAGGTCYCDYSKTAFIEYLQANLPREAARTKYGLSDYEKVAPPRERGEPFWMEWITFRGYSVAEFHKRLRTVAQKYNPKFMISGNVYGGFGYGPIAYDAAGNIDLLGRDGYDDFVYSEIQEYLDFSPRKTENGIKITNSPALKYLAAVTHGKPVIIYATEITPPIFPNPTERCLSAMAQINIAEAVANHTIFREKRQTPPGATDMYRFLAAQEPYLVGAQLSSNVAVLASIRQYLADEQSFAFSMSRILADQGIGHVIMVEDDIVRGNLERFDVVILPHIPLLSVQKQEALERYVRGGGRLLIMGLTGTYNEYGFPQTEAVLARMFGEQEYPGEPMEIAAGAGKVVFLPIDIPESGFLIPMEVKTGEVTTFGPSMANVFADIPEGYTRDRIDPDLRHILNQGADKVLTLMDGRVNRLVKATPYVEFTTMMNASKECLLVHLVNYDVTLNGTVTPAENLRIQLILPQGKKIRAASYNGALGEMAPLDYTTHAAGAQRMAVLSLNVVEVYGLAVLELEDK